MKPNKGIIKICTIVGARPQFIKATLVSSVIRRLGKSKIKETLIHTGQHFHPQMSKKIFREIRLPSPRYNLGVNQASHSLMTGRMMEKIEKIYLREKPDMVLVYGDTNSTLAGALAAAKLCIPIAHVEAGCRSFNMAMPEEINRVITDRLSSLLFCPHRAAVENLKREGIVRGVHLTGDIMLQTAQHFRKEYAKISLARWGLRPGKFVFCTIHRQENTDEPTRLLKIMQALRDLARSIVVVFPIHPRTAKTIRRIPKIRALLQGAGAEYKGKTIKDKKAKILHRGILQLPPLGYMETQRLLMGSRAILTDSGGLQKEAYFHHRPCVTLRPETEWTENLVSGWNQVIDIQSKDVVRVYQKACRIAHSRWRRPRVPKTAEKILSLLLDAHGREGAI